MEAVGCVVSTPAASIHPSPPPLISKHYALLSWADNNVGAAGAERLAQALECNSTLTLLNLLSMFNCDDVEGERWRWVVVSW